MHLADMVLTDMAASQCIEQEEHASHWRCTGGSRTKRRVMYVGLGAQRDDAGAWYAGRKERWW